MGNLKSTCLLIKYSIPTILIEWTNLLRIKSLNVKFSKYEKQSTEGVLQKGALKTFAKFIEKCQKYPWGQWRRSGVFIVNFERIPHLVLMFLLLTLSR